MTTGYMGAEAIRQAFAAAGWPMTLRMIRWRIEQGQISAFRVGKLFASTDEDVRKDIERWRSEPAAG